MSSIVSLDQNHPVRADRWRLAQGIQNGLPTIVRFANAYEGLAPLPGWDNHVIVSVQLRNPRPNGAPSREEVEDLDAFEINLCRLFEAGHQSLCALVVTSNGLSRLIFYTQDPVEAKERLDLGLGELKGFQFNVAIEPARDWAIYRNFAGWFDRPAAP
jgi:hypothetical protein